MTSTVTGMTTSRIMRERERKKPISDRLRAAGAASCGENLRTVSAILLFQDRLLPLQRLPQVLLHDGQMREQRGDLVRVETGERGLHQVLAKIGQLLQQRSRGGCQ